MEIVIRSTRGDIFINKDEVKILTIEILERIPGIVRVKKGKYYSSILNLLTSNKLSGIAINQIKGKEIGISCHIVIKEGIRLDQIASSVQEILKYSIERKYGLKVNYIDIYVEEME